MNVLPQSHKLKHEIYHTFQTMRHTFSPQIWEENGGASYSLNVAYLARGGGRGDSGAGFIFLFYFPPLKPRYVLWSGVSYSMKNVVLRKITKIISILILSI